MSDSSFSSNCAFGVAAHLKIWGGPVYVIGGESSAVWPQDIILVMDRIGNRRLCRVYWGEGKRKSFFCLIPKKWLNMSLSWAEANFCRCQAAADEMGESTHGKN